MSDVVERARKKVQKAIEAEEEERRRILLRKRIELAHSGVKSFENGKPKEAVQNFLSYLKILENWKKVGDGGLQPNLFDARKDLHELMLISAVYWDLVKIFDRAKSASSRKNFQHYMEKFVLFSKGMPFQPLSSETLRKYITNNKPIHKDEFKNAYKVIGKSSCFVVSSLIDVTDIHTLPRLRRFRDEVLLRTTYGQVFVKWYYRNGPKIAEKVDRLPHGVRRLLGVAVDGVAKLVE